MVSTIIIIIIIDLYNDALKAHISTVKCIRNINKKTALFFSRTKDLVCIILSVGWCI